MRLRSLIITDNNTVHSSLSSSNTLSLTRSELTSQHASYEREEENLPPYQWHFFPKKCMIGKLFSMYMPAAPRNTEIKVGLYYILMVSSSSKDDIYYSFVPWVLLSISHEILHTDFLKCMALHDYSQLDSVKSLQYYFLKETKNAKISLGGNSLRNVKKSNEKDETSCLSLFLLSPEKLIVIHTLFIAVSSRVIGMFKILKNKKVYKQGRRGDFSQLSFSDMHRFTAAENLWP